MKVTGIGGVFFGQKIQRHSQIGMSNSSALTVWNGFSNKVRPPSFLFLPTRIILAVSHRTLC